VNFRILCCIVLGVFTAHLGLFMFLMHLRPQVKVTPSPKPNFTSVSQTFVDHATGEKTTYREITVSTTFAELPAAEPPAIARSGDAPLVHAEPGNAAASTARE
jgi:hypothetical protein